MVEMLLDSAEKLHGAGIGVDNTDRLGRSILHLATQFGLSELVKRLIASKTEGQ